MKKLSTIITVLIAFGLAAPSAGAASKPTPEAVQAWAAKPQKIRTHHKTTVVSTPVDLIGALGVSYTAILGNNDAASTAADDCSKNVDDERRALTHSPDKSLNKLIDKALNQLGDVCDEVRAGNNDAPRDAHRSNKLWAQVEATLHSYGIDTGSPWALSTFNTDAPPPTVPPPPPPTVTYDLTGQGAVSVTLENASGGTEQFETPLPYHLDLGASVGGFLYISAQLQDSGTVTCTIKEGDQVIQTATSTGQYVIASCSGSA